MKFIRNAGFAALVGLIAVPVSAYEVRGVAVDSVGETIPFATYRIYDGGNVVTANTTGEQGEFVHTLGEGSYKLTLSYVGMRDATREFTLSADAPLADLGQIVMRDASEMLDGVTVTATKPLVTKEIDRIGYDVQADEASKTSSLSEILRKVPMLSVEADGTIKVNGSTDFKVYKNGRPNNAMSNNAKDIFAAIPASMIKRVEVITEPGAKYDAEGVGAILNIVTVENMAVKGVMGNARVDADTRDGVPGGSLWLSSQIDKVTFSANAGYNHIGGSAMKMENMSDFAFAGSGDRQLSRQKTRSKGGVMWFGADGSWDIDTLNLFTVEFGGYYYKVSPKGEGVSETWRGDELISGYSTTCDYPKTSYFDINLNANYQHLTRRKGEIYTLSYALSTTKQDNDERTYYHDFIGDPVDYSAVLAKYKLNFIEHTFQADWTRPFGGVHTLDAGAKYIIRRNHSTNDNEYVGWMTVNDDFSHVTNVAALYAQYSARVRRFLFRAGLRYEFSHLKASYADASKPGWSTSLNDLVPSAAISYQVNDANSLTFNYAARINRPGISYLNPTLTITPTTVSSGNPDLESAMHHSLKLTYMLIRPKFNFNFSANYELSNNGIATVTSVGEGDVIYSSYDNVGRRRRLAFNAFAQWSVTPKTSFMVNGGVDYVHNSQGGMSLGHWEWNGYARIEQVLPFGIRAELGMMRFNGSDCTVYSYTTAGSFANSAILMFSLSRSFLKENRLSLRADLMNLVGPSRRGYTTNYVNGDYVGRSQMVMDIPCFARFSVAYRFGTLNAQVKKTARSIDNDDLVGRKK